MLDVAEAGLLRPAAAAFGERRAALDPATGGTLYGQLAGYRTTVALTPQLVHAALLCTFLVGLGVGALLAWRVPRRLHRRDVG